MNGDKPQPSIVCRNVVKTYGSGNAEVHALRGVDLDVYPGEITMLVGPSGCGKTTLLSVVAGILRPTSGSVVALGTELTKLNSWRRTAFRRQNVGFVFQQFNLLPALTAAENASVPLVIQGYSKRAAMARRERTAHQNGHGSAAAQLARAISPAASSSAWRSPGRSCITRTCWSATSRLRPSTQRPGTRFWSCFATIAIEGDRAVIIVTHDSRIFEFADTLARMDDGQIVSIERQAKGGRALTA